MERPAPPGWYPSHDGREEQWWDGYRWSGYTRPRMRPRRKVSAFLWLFLAVQALFVLVLVAVIAGGGGGGDCGGLNQELCDNLNAAATESAVMELVLVWAAADVILGISYAVYRLAASPDRARR